MRIAEAETLRPGDLITSASGWSALVLAEPRSRWGRTEPLVLLRYSAPDGTVYYHHGMLLWTFDETDSDMVRFTLVARRPR